MGHSNNYYRANLHNYIVKAQNVILYKGGIIGRI